MAVSVAECDAMLTSCRANNVKLSVGYRLQFEPRHARELDWGVFTRMSGRFSFVMKEPAEDVDLRQSERLDEGDRTQLPVTTRASLSVP
jgi:hypothetical protein